LKKYYLIVPQFQTEEKFVQEYQFHHFALQFSPLQFSEQLGLWHCFEDVKIGFCCGIVDPITFIDYYLDDVFYSYEINK
jgi:hypothetical protein